MSCIFADMANYRGALLRYRLHIAGMCMFLLLFFVSLSFMQVATTIVS